MASQGQTHVMNSHSSHSQTSLGSSSIIGSYYRVDKKIGEGSFGVVFAGVPAYFVRYNVADYVLRQFRRGPEAVEQFKEARGDQIRALMDFVP